MPRFFFDLCLPPHKSRSAKALQVISKTQQGLEKYVQITSSHQYFRVLDVAFVFLFGHATADAHWPIGLGGLGEAQIRWQWKHHFVTQGSGSSSQPSSVRGP